MKMTEIWWELFQGISPLLAYVLDTGDPSCLQVNDSFPNEGEFAMNASAGKISQPVQIL
jgi:hypothetical protein